MKTQMLVLGLTALFAGHTLMADSTKVPAQTQEVGDGVKGAARKSVSKLKEGFQGSQGRKEAQAKRIEEEKQADKLKNEEAQAEQNTK